MFKNFLVSIFIALFLLYGCTKKDVANVQPSSLGMNSTASYSGYAKKGADGGFSKSISVDSANRMIESYLYSINYPANDSGLRSLSFNADTLRAYLTDKSIKDVKFMLAHQAEYMNSGHFGEFAGMNPSALTLVIVGVNEDGVHVRNSVNEVYEHLQPCPFNCNVAYSDSYLH